MFNTITFLNSLITLLLVAAIILAAHHYRTRPELKRIMFDFMMVAVPAAWE